MDKEALQYLDETRSAGKSLNTFTPAALVPNEMRIESLEQFQERPDFFRGKLETPRISDFTDYLGREATDESSAVFLNPDGTGANAIIDMGTGEDPEWGRHIARLILRPTAEYSALCQFVSRGRQGQRELIEFLEDHAYCITATIDHSGDGQDTAYSRSANEAAEVIRKLKVKSESTRNHSEGDYRSEVDGMEAIEMSGQDDRTVRELCMTTPLFEDTDERNIIIRLQKGVDRANDKPTIALRIVAHERLITSVREEIETCVKEAVPALRVYSGTMNLAHKK